MLIFNRDGQLLSSFPAPVKEAHQLTLVTEGDQQVLWLADHGKKVGSKDPDTNTNQITEQIKSTLACAFVRSFVRLFVCLFLF